MALSIAICFLALTAITLAQEDGSYEFKEKKCGRNDCPDYVVTKTTDKYEVRSYGRNKWVVTNDTASEYKKMSRKSFRKLFSYIQGANDQQAKIAMTVPVLTAIQPAEEGDKTLYTMHFFVPYKFQDNTPIPTSKEVQLVTYDPVDFYVCRFGGYMSDESIKENKDKCFKALADDGIVIPSTEYYNVAGYDAPWKFFNRRNEILIFKM